MASEDHCDYFLVEAYESPKDYFTKQSTNGATNVLISSLLEG